ncbi:WxL domain-containing protein [Lactococcus garvieae]|uniref:WxL domain-containing protein n=1 Tax=Lactococcus garvieae TaxID=1363 RepID=UPI00385461D1
MKKVITLSSIALILGATALPVAAESVNPTQWDSKGIVEFEANDTDIPEVTDPEAPGETGPGGTAGALAIDYVSDLDFDTHKISASDQTYYAAPDTHVFKDVSVANFVEMHDLRGLGTGNNTELTVTQEEQFKNDKTELKSAVLSFSLGKGMNSKNGSYVPNSVANFALTPGEAQKVMSTDGTVGQFLTSYGVAADYKGSEEGGPISLSIPSGSARAGSYSATLHWDLTVAP